ncbi:hypothetical protein CY34DRAFT_136565 [Suillus luteus UH-Slu-Lm8-n1]|uniref:Uncharacterized protein n=1 Tax=Suillus luteus UH-Slu-Lm8-n1 TaxID=930992 RepID=A0A0D0BHF9_9AGAM|nr:hypothetical protein CY34DRAFT_136565 [Suillus luteus UH-Slu-Lm8-n1]
MSTHTYEAPQASFVHGPFRILRTLGVGGYAKAVAAQHIPSNHLMCIKVFQKHNLMHKSTALSLSKELESREYGIACKNTMTAKDKPAKRFSWHISPGRSVRSARSESSFAPQATMLPWPTDTSTEEHSHQYIQPPGIFEALE